ncbi:MAG: glutamate 5-kinase [Pseudomonadota bacterium]
MVKLGSALLVEEDGRVRRQWLSSLIADIAALRREGCETVIVSSGAIALGARRLGLDRGGRGSLDDAQAAAAAGQIVLAGLYADLLQDHGLAAAQLLLTLGDLADRPRYLNAGTTLARLLTLGAVPVVNENDSTATEEIRFGDNDRLAARVAQAAGADLVILLSTVDALYDRDPATEGARRIVDVPQGTVPDAALGPSGGMGSGGMAAKVEAGRIAADGGIGLVIADGRGDHALAACLGNGEVAGTWFRPAPASTARKSWLRGHLDLRGRVVVDAGAAAALQNGGSLLAAGIAHVDGEFQRGDIVAIVDVTERVLGHGLVGYRSADVAAIAGLRSEAQAAILGHAPRSAVIHRNDMVLL